MNFDTFRDFHPIFNLPTHMDMWNRVFLKPFYAFLFVAGDRVDRGLLVPLRTDADEALAVGQLVRRRSLHDWYFHDAGSIM